MLRLALLIVTLVAFAGCNETNSEFCNNPNNANDPICKTGGQCNNANDCADTPNFPVCDLADNGGTCVQCTASEHAACMGMTPRCEGHTCVGCVDDNDCGGTGVCLSTGACADPSSILHAKVTGSDVAGCGDIGNECILTRALAEVTGTKNIIKLDDAGPYIAGSNSFTVDTDATIGLIIDARGAVLHRNMNGPILTINSGKVATILGGTIENAMGTGGDGIRCNSDATLSIYGTTIRTNAESGIQADTCTLSVIGAHLRGNSTASAGLFAGIRSSDGSITISRSSIVSNRGGGIVVNNNGRFEIVGNVFMSNGDNGADVSGVSIDTTASGNRLEFNTITQNQSNMTNAAGVQCSATNLTAQNNIIWNNINALDTNGTQVSGTCSHAYSDIGPTFAPSQDDHDNVTNDPSFVNATSDLHLQPGTPIRGKANPAADLTGIASKDLDGNVRVAPATPGAYVAPPQ